MGANGTCCESCHQGGACEVVRRTGYTGIRQSDGLWTIRNVPIFAEHTVRDQSGDERRIGPKWMRRAIAKFRERFAENGYLPPAHVNHHQTGREVRRAGFFRPRAIRKVRYEGENIWAMFADLVDVPDDVYQEIKAKGLPYRSVEIHDLNRPEIDSLALLADEVPFFRLSLLTIDREVREGEVAGPAKEMHQLAARAYRSLGGDDYMLLSDMAFFDLSVGDSEMKQTDRRKTPTKGGRRRYMVEDEHEDEGVDVIVEDEGADEDDEHMADDEKGAGAEEALAALAALQSFIESAVGGGGTPEEEAPEPVDFSARRQRSPQRRRAGGKMTDADKRLIKLEAENDALRKEFAKYQAKSDRADAISDATGKLLEAGFEPAEYREKIEQVFTAHGSEGVDLYVSTVLDEGSPAGDPPETFAEFAGDHPGDDDPIVIKYAQHGPDTVRAAKALISQYNLYAANGRGRPSFTVEEFVENELRAEGLLTKGRAR